MFKTFSAAILAAVAVARGTGDGTSQANAEETQLIDDAKASLTLFSYNANNAGTQEIHGDLELNGKTTNLYENLVFGFCIGQETTGWDCLRAETEVNATKITTDSVYSTSFLTRDFYSAKAAVSGLGDLTADNSILDEDPAKSWIPVFDKSSKKCTKRADAPNNGGEIVQCEKVNVHFYRNFTTDSAAQDVQLSLDKAGTEQKVMGFFGDFKDIGRTTPGFVSPPILGAVINNFKPVKLAHKQAVELAGNEGGGAGGSGSSGSISMAVTAVAAALYAMAF